MKKRMSKRLWGILLAVAIVAFGGCAGQTGTGGADESQVLYQINDDNADAEVSAFSFERSKSTQPHDLTVKFLDVGQGSCALISQGDSYMLIDGGDREYSSFVVSFLQEEGVESLDYVVVSHYDADHLNGIVGVLHVFDCKQVLAPDYEADTKVYQSFLNVIEEKQIPVTYPRLEDVFSFADSSFSVVGPASYDYKDANSNSLGIRLEYGDSSFLICGDCTEESEQDLMYQGVYLESDVFAANHHGSQYSNSKEFLEAVDPSYVVISCGLENSYGHPDASVMLLIQQLEAAMYRTDLQGTIIAVSDGKSIRFAQEESMDYRSGTELKEAFAFQAAEDTTGAVVWQEEVTAEENEAYRYVLNTNTKKVHRPECSSVAEMEEKNKEYTTDDLKRLESLGYSPCKRCNP